jgi:hypothetical protein
MFESCLEKNSVRKGAHCPITYTFYRFNFLKLLCFEAFEAFTALPKGFTLTKRVLFRGFYQMLYLTVEKHK